MGKTFPLLIKKAIVPLLFLISIKMPTQFVTCPKISVITPVLNAHQTLEACLHSVAAQTYPNVEHIVMDGGSKDGSIEILEKNSANLSYWNSKKDNGISDAFNQGIQQATGDYLYFLGASDALYHPNSCATLLEAVPPKTLLVCGRFVRTDEETNQPLSVAPELHPKHYNRWGLLKCLNLPHQGLLMHRAYFDRYGLFDTTLRYAMDYELILRSFHHKPTVVLKNILVATWRNGGLGKNKLSEVFDEYHAIKCQHNIAPWPVLWLINKIVRRNLR